MRSPSPARSMFTGATAGAAAALPAGFFAGTSLAPSVVAPSTVTGTSVSPL